MARRKVKLAFITNNVTRRASYQKRNKSLLKKVSELSTLCGIDACAIVYSPFDDQSEVWPNPMGVQQLIERYKNLPEKEQSKKMLDQETFVQQRISKLNEQLHKIYKENRQKEMIDLMNQSLADKSWLNNLMPEDKIDLELIIDQKLVEVNKRIEAFKIEASDQHQVAPALSAPTPLRLPMPTIPNQDFEEENIMPFNANQTSMWPNAFYP